jgi:hypothetical protein
MSAKNKNNGHRSGYRMPPKTHWHLYSLQALNSNKFIQVVNKVLRREFFLIK